MYPEVKGEMARKGITLSTLCKSIDCTISTLSLKLSGKAPLSLKEAKKIKKAIQSDLALEVLFRTEEDEV